MTESNDEPKSAYELAMERLRKKDAEQGIEQRSLSEAQKAAIAEVRTGCEAKLAQEEIMQRSRLAGTFDPAERETLEERYRRDRERIVADRDAKIEKIRRGE
ncbi:MAG: hypothetical protein HYS05_19480 [Acidobacteria bacterium]|nr:hypothetical protein [Acidobacteriota bacterium]